MANNKYTRRQKYISTDGGLTFNPVTPPEYIKGELIETDSVDCGAEVITWVPVEGVYICDVPPSTTRWIEDTGYMCVGYDKYNKEKEQISYDSGSTWTDTGNTKAGSTLIEHNSEDCGYVPITRWVADTGYVCVGYDKKNKEKEQISYDSGNTWTDTGNTRAGYTLIEQNSEDCGYVPPDYSREYLTTKALSSGNITLAKVNSYDNYIEPIENIQYSKNNGSWFLYTYGTPISVVKGDKIRWKGTIKDGNHYHYFSMFYPTADYKVYGNPLSLLRNDRFVDEPDSIYEYAYYHLFYGNGTLKDASNLALPATTLASSCYNGMFWSCTKLTTAPKLPATKLADYCYGHMFEGCSNLNNVICLATNISAKDCTSDWLYKVASTGTFVKNAAITSWGWGSGASGIPSGWTVQDA